MDGGDGDQTPGCAACRFIPRSCPPDCPLAPHFVPGDTGGADFARLNSRLRGRTVTESARSYPSPELRRIFVEYAVNIAAGTSTGEECRRLLVKAILSEAEKESERPKPNPPLSSSSSSSNNPWSSSVLGEAAAKFLSKLADVADGTAAFDSLAEAFGEGVSTLEAGHDQDQDRDSDDPDQDHDDHDDYDDPDQDHGDRDDPDFEDGMGLSDLEGSIKDDVNDDDGIELADLEEALKACRLGVDQELGVNDDGDSGGLSTDDDDVGEFHTMVVDKELQPEKEAKRLKTHNK